MEENSSLRLILLGIAGATVLAILIAAKISTSPDRRSRSRSYDWCLSRSKPRP